MAFSMMRALILRSLSPEDCVLCSGERRGAARGMVSSRAALGRAVQGGSRCRVAMHRNPPGVPGAQAGRSTGKAPKAAR